ncbi:hypothetical protein AAF712_009830 [Marasmius tenuissimus]|uniref:GH16 domain-containing protein n=1 Tax=Marasmius tenuissimus TaxID=585030 RepID=A0ABR2ZR78_9AGAR
MKLIHSLPLHLLLLLEASLILHVSASKREGNVLSRTVHKAHRFATRHSKGLADDIRVAFGAVLVSTPKSSGTGTGGGLRLLSSRDEQSVLGNPVVYCKSGGARLGGSNSGGGGSSGAGGSMGNGNGNSGGTSTMSGGSGGNRTDSTSSAPLGDRPTSTGGGGGSGGSQTTTSTSTTSTQAPTATPVNNSPFKIVDSHSGSNFFNGWNFWTFGDPTNGIVNYVDEATARANGLLEINSAGNAVMRVETTPQVSGNRRSVRIQTQLEIDKGLWIMDSLHVPTGCGTWPAFWTNGPSWPFDGEFDIFEGVHDYSVNQATLHTDTGCTLSSASSTTLGISGTVITKLTCAVGGGSGNEGCGVRATTDNTYGAPFNRNKGGVYAGLIDSDGIAVWFFPRGSIPGDIESEAPLPSTWGTPMARWDAGSCSPDRYFNRQAAIFTNTLCGDWAGGVWNNAGVPGQEQSCAQRTGFATCEEYVRNNGGGMSEAYWEVKSVKIYQRK